MKYSHYTLAIFGYFLAILFFDLVAGRGEKLTFLYGFTSWSNPFFGLCAVFS
jgi:hypothetical protein